MKVQSRFFLSALRNGLCHLALCAVMLLAFAPAAGANAAWQCEGQQCGVTAWVCCCAAPYERSDSHCPPDEATQSGARTSAEKSGACPQECHCTMVMRDGGALPLTSTATATGPVLFLFAAILPVTIALDAPPTPETAQWLPSRAPPPTRFSLASCSRRGPPSF